jgi:hypothetical protein
VDEGAAAEHEFVPVVVVAMHKGRDATPGVRVECGGGESLGQVVGDDDACAEFAKAITHEEALGDGVRGVGPGDPGEAGAGAERRAEVAA